MQAADSSLGPVHPELRLKQIGHLFMLYLLLVLIASQLETNGDDEKYHKLTS